MWLYHTMGLKKVVDRMAFCMLAGQFCLWQIHAPAFCPGQNWRAWHSVADRSAPTYSVKYRTGGRRALSKTVMEPGEICRWQTSARFLAGRLRVLDLNPLGPSHHLPSVPSDPFVGKGEGPPEVAPFRPLSRRNHALLLFSSWTWGNYAGRMAP